VVLHGLRHRKHGALWRGDLLNGTNALWVNLYIPSTVELSDRGFKLTQETTFPSSDKIKFTVSCRKPVNLTLHLRLPAGSHRWRKPSKWQSTRSEADSRCGNYLKLERKWRDGDTIELRCRCLCGCGGDG